MLSVKVVTADIAGDYKFYVTNAVGNVTKTFHVEVQS